LWGIVRTCAELGIRLDAARGVEGTRHLAGRDAHRTVLVAKRGRRRRFRNCGRVMRRVQRERDDDHEQQRSQHELGDEAGGPRGLHEYAGTGGNQEQGIDHERDQENSDFGQYRTDHAR